MSMLQHGSRAAKINKIARIIIRSVHSPTAIKRCWFNLSLAARLLFSLTPAKPDVTKSALILRRNSLAVHPSVIKRHRQSLKKRTRNIDSRSRIRTLIKKARQAIDSKNQETAAVQLRAVDKALGKAVSKGIIKRNTASRWLCRLSRSASRIISPSS
jgi:small subunit ribosomal protein S20